MTFLDNDFNFRQTFGDHPTLLPERPWDSNSISTHQQIQAYANLCKLDIFMNLCRQDYVGEDNVDPGLNVVEVCRQISSLRQVWNSGSTIHTDTPDELYDKFTRLTVSLPPDATKWSLQLCSSYLAALSADLAEEVTSDETFRMPNLTTLTTKSLQVEALRTVRRHASTGWKAISKQKEKMATMFRSMNPNTQRGTTMQYSDDNAHGYHNDHARGVAYFQNSASLAETTLARYNEPTNSNPTTRFNADVETRLHPETGLQHPYNKSDDFLSRFPLGFRGCYNCGQTDHRSTKECPLAQRGIFDKKTFFSEMWAHKPHTKRLILGICRPTNMEKVV